jgi:glycosyltransferase involved in cell wall biosynthesis
VPDCWREENENRVKANETKDVSYPLAIFTEFFGMASQTFIRRHIADLLPGRTVVVSRNFDPSYDGSLDGNIPVLALDSIQPSLVERGIRAVARRRGVRPVEHPTFAVRRFLKQHRVEVIMGEHLDYSLDFVNLAKDLKLRFFAHGHGHDVSGRLRDPHWRDGYLRYNDTDGVITMSNVSKDRLIDLGMRPASIHVIPYGVDVPATPPVHPEQTPIRCLAVGRMVAKKAPIITLDAFRRALESYPELRLDFVGDGPLLVAAQQFVRSFSLASRVTLHGAKSNDDVRHMMNSADLFIQHSITPNNGDEEGMPVAILEAMAAALPVVSTRHAGIPEAVQEAITGSLVEAGDSKAMAERIVMLARNREQRTSMGFAGWKRASEFFSWTCEQMRLQQILGLQSR